MKNILSITKLLHKFTLGALLIAIAFIPLIIEINVVTAFVFIPIILIVSLVTSLMVEYQLEKINNELSKKVMVKQKINSKRKCIISKGFNCLHY